MSVTVYAKGLTVETIDGAPTPPASGSTASGVVTVYAKGLTVAVLDAVAQTVVVPEIVSFPINSGAITADLVQYSGGRYDRNQDPLILTTTAVKLPFQLTNQAAGGEQRAPLPYARYSWRVCPITQSADGQYRRGTGVERASYVPFASRGQLTFSGTMPFGLTLSTDGTISGTPTAKGAKDVTVTATLGASKVSTAIYVAIDSTAVAIYSGRPSIGHVGVPYSFSLAGKPFEAAGAFVGTLGDEPDGLYVFEIWGQGAGGSEVLLMMHGGFIDRNGGAKDCPLTIMQNGSRDWEVVASTGLVAPKYQYAIVPKALLDSTRLKPLTPRLGKPFSTMPTTASGWTRLNYVLPQQGVTHRPCRTRSGVTITENLQFYHYTRLIDPVPRLPLLDGPRGIATAPFTTHMRMGRNGKIYVLNPWQCFVIDATGTKRTLYGVRHKYAPYWREAALDGPEVEFVGDWDASIPLLERYAWESWGFVWDEASLFPIDVNAPIPPGETEHPHVGLGPRHFVTDRHGYVLEVQFDGRSHATPAKVRRWLAASDPWGIAADQENRVLYVAERGIDAITMWSMDTPNTKLGVFVANPAPLSLGGVSQSDRVWRGAGYSATRAVDCVAPEGVVIQDGYLYWGSLAQGEVRRKPLAGGSIEVCLRAFVDNNSNYVFIDISEGLFGTRGMIGVTTWSNSNVGRPRLYVPTPSVAADGTKLTHTQWTQFGGLAQGVVAGPGPKWETGSYGSAIVFGNAGNTAFAGDPPYGALACSSADGEISVYVQSDPTLDHAPDYAKADRGGDKYFANYYVLHGPYGQGPNVPLPWGADPDVDYFMDAICGLR